MAHDTTRNSTMRYNEIINELFDGAVPWQLSKINDEQYNAEFVIDNAHYAFNGTFVKNCWHINFNREGSYDKTNTGNQYAVFATVKNILEHLIKDKSPIQFEFAADLDEESRVKLYRRMSQQLCSKFGYVVKEKAGYANHFFTFIKTNPNAKDVVVETQRVDELFNQSVPYQVIARTQNAFCATFTIGEGVFDVKAVNMNGSFIITFKRGATFSITNTGDHFVVFATIRKCIDEFITEYQPDRFKFSADQDEPSRVKLYDRMAKQLAIQYQYSLEEVDMAYDKQYYFAKMNKIAESQIVNELFDNKAEWEVEILDSESFETSFVIDDNEYLVDCYVDGSGIQWEFKFSLNGKVTKTGTGNEFKVFATVMDIMDWFFTNQKPPRFMFAATLSEPSRVRLYGRIARNLSNKFGYSIKLLDMHGEKRFYLFKL